MKLPRALFAPAIAVLATAGTAATATYKVETDRPDAIYRCGETATFKVTVLATNGVVASDGTLAASLDNFGPEVFTNIVFDLSETNAFRISGTMREPGFLRLVLPGDRGFARYQGDPCMFSAAFEPERIRKGSPSPEDFDEFWADSMDRLDATVPLDPQLALLPERSQGAFNFWRVSFATWGGTRVYGYLSIPKNASAENRYPVRFQVPAAGEGRWTCDMDGSPDEIRMLMTVHPFEPPFELDALHERHARLREELKAKYGNPAYNTAGLDVSREDYYFFRAILGINRAVDWLASRPEVDLRRFTYTGTSQGGGFGLALMGLNGHFTKGAVFVPAMADTMGYLAGRASGWPNPVFAPPEGSGGARERNAPYFDGANFASRIRCPIRVAVGFSDTTCPPCAVYAAYNEIGVADKAILNGIGMTHGCFPAFYRELEDWLRDDIAGDCAFPLTLATNGDVALGGAASAFGLRIYREGWSGTLVGAPVLDAPPSTAADGPSDSVPFLVKDGNGVECVNGRVALGATAPNAASLSLRASVLADVRCEGVAMEFTLPAKEMAGTEWRIGDAAHGVFPEQRGETRLFAGMADSLAYIDPATRKPVELRFPQPVKILLQDSRLWGPNFTVRAEVPQTTSALSAGAEIAFDCTISHPGGIEIRRDHLVVIEAGDDWIPLENRKNIVAGSALDFSNFAQGDAPAGKYGFLKAVGDHFEFEGLPGVPQCFYGVNLCNDANYPDAALADELVTRLKRLGYNAIRIHHHDGTWAEARDRLDYLLAKCFEAGIYVTTDLYVSRRVSWRDIGFDRDGDVPNNVFKNLVALHEPAFGNWAAFARAFLEHVNPYTGRRYADEPGMPFICLVNEGTMGWAWNTVKTMDCTKRKWREWRVEGIPGDPASIDNYLDSAAAQCFAADMEKRAFEREKAFLESLGCKALLTSQNCADSQAMASARDVCDYVDNHFYHGNPKFLGKLWSGAFRFPNGNPARADDLSLVNAAYTRLAGKPYTITEWNFAGPGQYRAAGGLLAGAMAARQEWDGLWRFAYSHVAKALRDGMGAPHLFDLTSDALNQASERAVMALFLRGDMAPLEDKVALDVGPARLTPDDKPPVNRPAWMDEAWNVQVGRTTSALSAPLREASWSVFPLESVIDAPPVAPAPRGDFILDREKGTIAIDTPRTCGVFAEGGTLKAGALQAEFLAAKNAKPAKGNLDLQLVNNGEHLEFVDNPATVFALSLDGAPIPSSLRILVTHLTDAQKEGNIYADEAKSVLLRWGGETTLVRSGRARVSLALRDPVAYEVWGLATDGTRMERVDAHAESGILSFIADVNSGRGARMLYEIARKP